MNKATTLTKIEELTKAELRMDLSIYDKVYDFVIPQGSCLVSLEESGVRYKILNILSTDSFNNRIAKILLLIDQMELAIQNSSTQSAEHMKNLIIHGLLSVPIKTMKYDGAKNIDARMTIQTMLGTDFIFSALALAKIMHNYNISNPTNEYIQNMSCYVKIPSNKHDNVYAPDNISLYFFHKILMNKDNLYNKDEMDGMDIFFQEENIKEDLKPQFEAFYNQKPLFEKDIIPPLNKEGKFQKIFHTTLTKVVCSREFNQIPDIQQKKAYDLAEGGCYRENYYNGASKDDGQFNKKLREQNEFYRFIKFM